MTPFEWKDYLTFAEDLQQSRVDEAALRSAVSRAYYAAFNQAVSFLENNQIFVTSTGNKHEAVWKEFERGPNQNWKTVYRIGDNLKRRRIEADYLMRPQKWSDEAKFAVAEAKNIQHWLQQITPTKPSA